VLEFQSTRPYGARRARAARTLQDYSFNPRARMGRDYGLSISTGRGARFNPRARMGRDVDLMRKGLGFLVSIHAPVWGATRCIYVNPILSNVSIHAPVWGATYGTAPPQAKDGFQSTRPYGARLLRRQRWSISCAFQSTRPYGARRLPGKAMSCTRPFQSTRPYGARRQSWAPCPRRTGFNPRARMGRDLVGAIPVRWGIVSIHAPVWGATRRSADAPSVDPVSIHAPVWGATSGMRKGELCGLFQSTRPYGARHRASRPGSKPLRFNPRARMGRDQGGSIQPAELRCFNPRARMGRDG